MNLLKSFVFLFFLGFLLILFGGSIEIVLSSVSLLPDKVTQQTIAFLFSGIFILIFLYFAFPSIFNKIKSWLSISWKSILFFVLTILSIATLFSIAIILGVKLDLISQVASLSSGPHVDKIIKFFVLALTVGFTEELVYRGAISAYFFQKVDIRLAIVIISIFFALGHIQYDGVLPFLTAFSFGIASSILLLKTGSLLPSIGLHCGWNFTFKVYESFYDMKIQIIPFWGNVFEIVQLCLISLLIISILLLRKNLSNYFLPII